MQPTAISNQWFSFTERVLNDIEKQEFVSFFTLFHLITEPAQNEASYITF